MLPQNKGGQWTVASEEVVPKSEYGSVLKKPLLCRRMQQLSRENKQAAKDKEN